MSDLDEKLYAQYVSSFKQEELYTQGKIRHLWRWYDDKLGHWLKSIPLDARILEIGCGAGYMLGYLQYRGYTNVVGIDLAPEYVAFAVKSGYDAQAVDATQFLIDKQCQYDMIIAIDVIEHFSLEDGYALCTQIFHALDDNGHLLIQTVNASGLLPRYIQYGDLTHKYFYTPNSLSQLFKLIGFDEILFRETGPARWIHLPLFILWYIIRTLAMLIKFIEVGRIQTYWTENFFCFAKTGVCRTYER